MEILLREIDHSDLPIFFEQQRDTEARYMAAFTSKKPNDWEAFEKHWQNIMNNETVISRTILLNDIVVGQVVSFLLYDNREMSYWIGKEFWGKGIATKSLKEFLKLIDVRPLYARAAFDNYGSIRVLKKCGFLKIEESNFFANARGKEIKEYIFELV